MPTTVLRYLSGKAQDQEPENRVSHYTHKTAGEVQSHFWSASVPPAKGLGTGQKVPQITWQTETTTSPPITADEALKHLKRLAAEQHSG